jgi:tetratricopeptide (TPR) repeat protein
MRRNNWIRYFLLTAAFVVVGCNIFNPDGEGDVGDGNLTEVGEQYFREGKYAKSLAAFEEAIKQDSTNSMAYYGYAKAAVQLFQLNKLSILNDLQATAGAPESFAFLQHNDTILTLRLQAAAHVRLVLNRLTDRDSLSLFARYLTDSSYADRDTLFEARKMFMENYFTTADQVVPGYRKRNLFPLTDFRMPAKNLIVDFTAFDLLYTITRLYDLDQNDTIDSRDALMKKLKFGSTGGFSIDSLSSIQGDLETDSASRDNLNALISSMQSGLLSSAQLASLIGAGQEDDDDTTSSKAETSGNMDSVITSMGDAVLFYQFGDRLDNDGDGCIDEEIMDDKDNDLDGYVDEDARVIPAEKPDNVDNNRDGKKDPLNPPPPFLPGNDSLEAPVGPVEYQMRPQVLGFVYAYMDSAMRAEPDPNKIDWVKIKKGADGEDLQVRINIQKDSLAVRIPVGGPVPDSLVAKLANAKLRVGGCWRNYNN